MVGAAAVTGFIGVRSKGQASSMPSKHVGTLGSPAKVVGHWGAEGGIDNYQWASTLNHKP